VVHRSFTACLGGARQTGEKVNLSACHGNVMPQDFAPTFGADFFFAPAGAALKTVRCLNKGRAAAGRARQMSSPGPRRKGQKTEGEYPWQDRGDNRILGGQHRRRRGLVQRPGATILSLKFSQARQGAADRRGRGRYAGPSFFVATIARAAYQRSYVKSRDKRNRPTEPTPPRGLQGILGGG